MFGTARRLTLSTGGGLQLPATVNYIAEGDSITYGLGVGGTAGSYPALVVAAATKNPPVFSLSNIAVSGLALTAANGSGAGMVPGYASRTGPQFDATKALNIVSIMGGTNDSAATNRITIYRGLRSFVRLARATGYQRVILGTIPSRSDTASADGTFDGNTLPVNLDIRALWNSDLDADAVMDFALPGGGFDTAANAVPNQVDKLHDNAAGYALKKVPALAALNAVVQGPGTRVQAPATWSLYDLSTYFTLSNAGRTVAWTSGGFSTACVRALPGASTGKVYWELVLDNVNYVQVGVVSSGFEPFYTARNFMNQPNAVGAGYGGTNGNLIRSPTDNSAGTALTTQPVLATGDVVQFAMDATARLLWYRKAGQNWNGNASADPATGVGGVDVSGLGSGKLYPAAYIYANGGQVTSRFAGSQVTGTIPTGFSPIGGP